MRICLDYDGTLARTHDLVCDLINYKRGSNVQARDITDWNWFKDHGYGDDFWGSYDLIDKWGLRSNIAPYDSHVEQCLTDLLSDGYELEVVTANDLAARSGIEEWLRRILGDVKAAHIPVTCLGRVGSAEKLALGHDIVIDDNPSVALTAKVPVLVPDQPWNASLPITVNRFFGFDEVRALVDKVEEDS